MALSESRHIILPPGQAMSSVFKASRQTQQTGRTVLNVSSTSYRMPKTPDRQPAIELPRLLNGAPVVREE